MRRTACGKKLSLILVVLLLMLWNRLPDGRGEKKPWEGWEGSPKMHLALRVARAV